MNDTPEKARSKTAIIAAIAVLVLLAITFAGVLKVYDQENEKRAASIELDTAQAGPDRIDAYAKIITADPVRGDVIVRIELTPQGKFVSEDGVTLSRDIELFVNTTTGKQVHEFRKDKRMGPVEAVLDMYEGEPMDYPFDEHVAQLAVYFDNSVPEPAAGAAAEAEEPEADEPAAAAGADDEAAEIPIALELFGSVNGLQIEAEKSKENVKDYAVIDLTIRRATTARFFSIFIMSAMWLLTVAVLFLVFHVLTGRRKIEVGMFSFLGALLFAFPALRNSQPGTPPIGTYSDFIAFFWAEVLIALCLLTILSIWLIRGPGGDKA